MTRDDVAEHLPEVLPEEVGRVLKAVYSYQDGGSSLDELGEPAGGLPWVVVLRRLGVPLRLAELFPRLSRSEHQSIAVAAEAYSELRSLRRVAERFGGSAALWSARLRKAGVETRSRKGPRLLTEEQIRELAADSDGLTWMEVSAMAQARYGLKNVPDPDRLATHIRKARANAVRESE